MKFKEIFDLIEEITSKDKLGPFERFTALSEEVGELAVAIQVENGFKKKDLDETSGAEAVDVCILALSFFFSQGGDREQLKMIFEEKLKKKEEKDKI